VGSRSCCTSFIMALLSESRLEETELKTLCYPAISRYWGSADTPGYFLGLCDLEI